MALLLLTLAGVAYGQSSTSYLLDEHAIHTGGTPTNDGSPSSASYVLTSVAIGQGASTEGASLTGSSYRLDAGFGSAYLPPGEAANARFTDAQSLRWDAARAAGSYAVYRDELSALGGAATCIAGGLASTELQDADVPATGNGWAYLVTVLNRLDQEGSAGQDSTGAERSIDPCP